MFYNCNHVYAVDLDDVLEFQADALGLDELEELADGYAPEFSWKMSPDLNEGLSDLLQTGTDELGGVFRKALKSSLLIMAIVFFSGIAEGASAIGSNKIIHAVPFASALAIAAVSASDANSLIGMGKETIEKIEIFANSILPAVAAAMAASGSPARAAASKLATMLFSDVLMSLINRILLPLIFAYLAMYTAYAAIGNEGLKRIASTVKWVVTLVLTGVMIAFVGYLSVSGVIAGATDAITLKATKFTVSSVVPVVGGILSDASETVLAGAGILKNSIGVFGMLVVLGMCLVPFLELGVHYLMYKITATLAATVSDSKISGLIDGIGTAFGLVLGMTGAAALLFLVSMISAVQVTAS